MLASSRTSLLLVNRDRLFRGGAGGKVPLEFDRPPSAPSIDAIFARGGGPSGQTSKPRSRRKRFQQTKNVTSGTPGAVYSGVLTANASCVSCAGPPFAPYEE